MSPLNVLSVAAPESLKPSAYNVFVERGENVWACNTRSGAFARLTPGQYKKAQRYLEGELPRNGQRSADSLFQGLVRGQFLVPEDLDEMKMLKVRNQLTRYSSRGLGLVIAPTLRCNFDCPYCYVDLNANKMPVGVRDRVKKFFANKLEEDSKASVCWTGGDPSIAMDVVEDLSRHFIATCEEKGADYDAVMITNGYLLDRKMLDTVKRCDIKALQITFDGAKQFHDSTRALAGGRSTYDQILSNVVAAKGEVVINIRVNVDSRNASTIPVLLDDLASHGLAEPGSRVAVYFAHVDAVNDQALEHEESCLGLAEYAALEPELIRYAMNLGFRRSTNPLKRQLGSYCGANSNNHFVIDSKAQLQKCYDDLGHAQTHGIGYIDESGEEVVDKQANLLNWISWDPFEFEECRSCKVLPMCMGGCSYHVIRNKEGIGPGCLKLRYNLDEIINLYGEHMSSEKEGQFSVGGCASGGCSSM